MSAIRTSRRAARSSQTPYTRTATKKPSWSISGFLKSLIPWNLAENDSNDMDAMEEDDISTPDSPATLLRDRGHQIERETNLHGNVERTPPPPPRRLPLETPAANSSLLDSQSPENDLETVSARIRGSLNKKEVDKLCAMLKDESNDEPEPFRFSATPSTPARATSPYQASNANGLRFTFGVSSAVAPAPTPSPRKTLNRNPNGVYRWQGGGSAKATRSKNRYSSPAFGPSQPPGDRLILKDTQIGNETPRSDLKRRKIVDEPNPSSSSSNSTFLETTTPKSAMRAAGPDPSPTRIKQALPFPVSVGSSVTPRLSSNASVNASSSSSRLQVPQVSQKPTVPVVPSPLRQAWSGASPPSQTGTLTTSSTSKQTKAANYMAELIKEVTPPKRPDLSNPYQTASPLGKVSSAPKGRVGRRVRATGKPTTPVGKDEKEKDKDLDAAKEKTYSTQAIIEATVPKGTKRSRPPGHLEKTPTSDGEPILPQKQTQGAPSSNRSRYAPYVEDEIPEDVEDDRSTKRSKTRFGYSESTTAAKPSDIIIEEVEVVSHDITPEKPQSVTSPPPAPSAPASTTVAGRSGFTAMKSTSAPKEPSKLRYSYQPETSSSPAPSPPAQLPVSTSSVTPAATSTSLPMSSIFAPPPPPLTSFSSPAPTLPSTSSREVSILPSTFDTSKHIQHSIQSHSDNGSHINGLTPPQQAALKVPKSSLPTFTFSANVEVPNSAHAKAISEAKAVPKHLLPRYSFNDDSKAKITPLASIPLVPFNWGGAGVKPPASDGSWICSFCSLSNPATATEQCEVCDTKRGPKDIIPPPAISAPAPTLPPPASAVQTFNWAAAGMKPLTTGDNWTCALCGLSNPASATDKCDTCESPR